MTYSTTSRESSTYEEVNAQPVPAAYLLCWQDDVLGALRGGTVFFIFRFHEVFVQQRIRPEDKDSISSFLTRTCHNMRPPLHTLLLPYSSRNCNFRYSITSTLTTIPYATSDSPI